MNKNRAAIFIDGGNLHHIALKKIGVSELGFDFEAFTALLANGKTISSGHKRYYIGTVREQEGNLKSKYSMARQTRFFAELKKYGWILRTSKLKTRTETITVDDRMKEYQKLKKAGITEITYERKREKGIDVMLATDLIVGAVENVYDIAIVVSSDADLLPAIKWVRDRKKKHVEYIGFSIEDKSNPKNSTKPLQSMISNTDTQRVLVESDLKKLLRKQPFKGVIIDESLENKDILKKIEIISTEIEKVTDEHKTPWVSQWTMHSVIIPVKESKEVAEEISKALDSKYNWYADFKSESHHYIIFKNKVFLIDRKSKDQYNEAKEYGISLGIPEYQVDFHPDIEEWKRA
ncbi:MAG: NYN domain-containing protein [Candidatus Paceibacterota bacterium]|jgi:uncharacterized LabA/DUF88 family protein